MYVPNEDRPAFFANTWEHVLSYNTVDHIICGDFDTVHNYSENTYNYARQNNPKAKNEVDRGINLLNLTSNSYSYDRNPMSEITKAHGHLVEIREDKLKGSNIRSQAKWVEKGEKPQGDPVSPYILSRIPVGLKASKWF